MKYFVIVCAVLFLAGCKSTGEKAAKEISEPIREFGQNVEHASENIEKGLAELSKIDPFALQKLLNENASLREQLQRQQQQLLSFSGSSIELQLENRKLYFLPVTVVGDFDVDGLIDTNDNVIMKRAFRMGATSFAPDYGVFYDRWCPQHYGQCSKEHTAGNLIGAIAAYHGYVMDEFRSFERGQSQILQPIYLSESLFGYGARNLKIKVTPRAAAKSGEMKSRAQLITKSPDGTQEIVRDFEWERTKDSLESDPRD